MTGEGGLLVAGAGLCGLAAAWRAHLAGRNVEVVEADDRVGGVVRTEGVRGYRTERAAAAFPASAAGLLEILGSLPSPPEVRRAPPEAARQALLTARGLVALPRSPPALVASPLLPPGSTLRLVAEGLFGPRRVDRPETAAAFVRRRFGRDVAERFLAPMTLGIYGTHPDDLGAADAFPALVEAERSAGSLMRAFARRKGTGSRELRTFEGGMEAFPRAVAAALGARVRTGVAVTAVEPGPGGRPRVALSDGGVREPDEVLLAVPAPAQARLLAPLSRTASQALGAVRYVPIVVVYVGLPPGSAPPVPASFGFLRGRGAPDRILGCAIATSLDPTAAPAGHALLRVFLGGGRDPGAVDLDDDALRAVVERDLARALGGPVRTDVVSIVRHPAAIPVFSPGHRARMAAAGALVAPFHVRLSGSHVTGVGVDSCCRAS